MRNSITSLYAGLISMATVVSADPVSPESYVLIDLTDPTGTAVYSPENVKNKTGAGGAFDNDLGSDNGRWLVQSSVASVYYTFSSPTIVNAYQIWSGSSWYNGGRDPKAFKLLGTNDDPLDSAALWMELSSETNQTNGWGPGKSNLYLSSNAQAYTTYKLSISENIGDPYISIDEVELYRISLDNRVLVITGAPKEYGSVSPVYGTVFTNIDAVMSFSAPDVWTNDAGTEIATCSGYKIYSMTDEQSEWTEISQGIGSSFDYTMPGNDLKVEWLFDSRVRIVTSDSVGGSTSGAGWYSYGSNATLTAEASDGHSFVKWMGDISGGVSSDNPFTVQASGAMIVRPIFRGNRYLAMNGSDENDGESAETPYATVAKAMEQMVSIGSGRLNIAEGTYKISSPIILNDEIQIFGQTGNPSDVIITNTAGSQWGIEQKRVCDMSNAKSLLSGLTLSGGNIANHDCGFNLRIRDEGGTVSNCVISCGSTLVWLCGSGAVSLQSPGALLTHCIVTSNSGADAPGWGYYGSAASGIYVQAGRAENCLITKNRTPGVSGNNSCVVAVDGGSLVNCTIVSNEFHVSGGVYARSDASSVINCAIAENYSVVTNALGESLYTQIPCGGKTNVFINCATDGVAPINKTCFTGTAQSFFRNYTLEDFYPSHNSILIGHGVNYNNMASEDLTGNARLVGKFIDIGCYESKPRSTLVIIN